MIRYIQQAKGSKDCGRCVAAMALGTTVEDVRARLIPGKGAIRTRQLIAALGPRANGARLTTWRGGSLPDPGVVRVYSVFRGRARVGHFALVADGQVLDPDWGEPATMERWLKDTREHGWEVAAFLRLVPPLGVQP